MTVPTQEDCDAILGKLNLLAEFIKLNSPEFVDHKFLEIWINAMQLFIANSYIRLCDQDPRHSQFILPKLEQDIKNWNLLFQEISKSYHRGSGEIYE